ncbi:MAG TPA: hypothetical protein VEB59_07490 [Gemmatimonadales bacterium]|nr:hypothetical protein [Gemmatimonadales bacterium]
MPSAYATVEELNEHLGSAPAGAQLLLDRASRDIRAGTLCAVYAVDDDGMPTDADVVAAMKAACLEQVAGRLEAGDAKGLGGQAPAGFSLGRLSIQRGNARKVTFRGRLVEQAYLVLQEAGLTGHAPHTGA